MSTTDSSWHPPEPDATKHTMVYMIIPPTTSTPSGPTPTFKVVSGTTGEDPLTADGGTHTLVLKI